MKKKVWLIVIALASILCLALGITACANPFANSDLFGGGLSVVEGKYYFYKDEAYDYDHWIELKKKTWTTSESNSGNEYEVTDTSIALYTEMAGTKVIFSRGTVKHGVLTLEIGVTRTFCKSGAMPNNPQDDRPEPTYKTVTFFLNGGNGSIDDMKFEVGKVMAHLPNPQREGYIFIGWKDAFGNAYSTSTVMPNENIELYAQWEKIVSSYNDDYVSLKPASEGYKDKTFYMMYRGSVDEFVYVELTSDDLGGPSYVGQDNNFTLRTLDSMEYKVKSGYTWQWYQGDFTTPNGAQRFTLEYGSNIQFVTVSDGSGVVQQTYLLDIYVKHDYYVKLYTDLYAKEPYKTVRVIENERLDADTPVYTQGNYSKFEFDCRKYYNESTRKYEEYIYSTPVQHDIKLYQTYKPYTLTGDLDEGTLSGKLTVVPYTENASLPTPTKEGYDFLGWQWENGKYFSDITGYLGINYLNAENVGMELKAVYAKKQFAYTVEQKEDEEIHSVLETVPVVTYTDETQTEIFDITYVILGSYVSPEKTPFHEDKIFVNWQTYDHKTGEKEKIAYDTPVAAPIALFANEANASYFNGATGTSKTYNVVPLNAERTFTSGSTNSEYRAYLPTDGEYTLEISTTGEVTLTVSQYGSIQSRSYTVKSSTPSTIYLQYKGSGSTTFPDGGYITFSVTSLSGSFTTRLSGATTRMEESPLPYNELLPYAKEHTFTPTTEFVDEKVAAGYTFLGWFDEKDNPLEGSGEYTSTVDEPVKFTSKWGLYQVTVSCNDNSAGQTSIGYSHEENSVETLATLTATTNKGYTFVGWYKDNEEVTTELSYQIIMGKENVSFEARWSKVTLMVNDPEAGSVEPLCDTYKVGDQVTLTATTNMGYMFIGWYKNEDEVSKDSTYQYTMTKENVTLEARWKKIEYTLIFVYDSDVGDAEEIIPASYTIKDLPLTLPTLIGKNGNKHISIGWKAEDGTRYTDEIPVETTGDLTLTVIWGVTEGTHTPGEENECKICGASSLYTRRSNDKIYFGEYPQTEVKDVNDIDSSLRNSLNMAAGSTPTSSNAGKWMDYNYNIGGETESFMWYIDVDYQGNRYRGVYFASYRPYHTNDTSPNFVSYQANNGYYIKTLYWFKYEPIEWRILEEKDGTALLMANIILDAQPYYHSRKERSEAGKTIHPNNYKESDIRKWGNETFCETAFDALAKQIIETTTVDNSASTTASGSNSYACENTEDKVFLLSYKEILNTSYGFSSSWSTKDTARQLKSTDYAKSQGIHVSTISSSLGNSNWWLRSPYSYKNDYVAGVDDDGSHLTGDLVICINGVVPALRIKL